MFPKAVQICYFGILLLCVPVISSHSLEWQEILNDVPEAFDPSIWNHEAIFLGHQIRCSVPEYQPEFSPDIVIGALSWEGTATLRQAVRDTWARTRVHDNHEILVWFLMTVPQTADLIEEAKIHNDMVFFDFSGGYRFSLSPRSQLFFTVALDRFPNARWFMKTDDDSFFLIDLLYEHLRKMKDPAQFPSLVAGMKMDVGPIRRKESPWFISEEDFPGDMYPPYPLGPGYVLSNPLVRCLSVQSQSSESSYFLWEDVLTGMLLVGCPGFDISDFHHPRFFLGDPKPQKDYGVMLVHRVKDPQYYENLFTGGCARVGIVSCDRREQTAARQYQKPSRSPAPTPEPLDDAVRNEFNHLPVLIFLAFQLSLLLFWCSVRARGRV